jgi:hypothetical protein
VSEIITRTPVDRWLKENGVSIPDLADVMPGRTWHHKYLRTWRLVSGKQKWTVDSVKRALGLFSERLGRPVTFEEVFGDTAVSAGEEE